jgi:protein-disulfide isomerase
VMNRLLALLLLGILASSSTAQTASSAASKNASANRAAQAVQPASPPTGATQAGALNCGCEGEPLPEVLAIVNGAKITAKQVDDALRMPLAEIQRQVTEARRLELDLQINSRLLDAEARRRGKTPSQVLEEEVLAKVKAPAEADVKAYFDQHKEQMDAAFEDAKPHISDYLRNQRQAEVAKAFAERLRAAADLKVLAHETPPPQTSADRERVFATLNGQAITSAHIEDALQPLLIQAQKQIYDLRRTHLNLEINDLLLEQEAQRRKLTARAVVEADVLPKVRKITEEDARKFYEGNRERLLGDFAQLRDQLIQYLAENEQQRAQLAFADRLRAAAAVQVFLKMPDLPRLTIATDDQPWKGSEHATVTIVEFTDYQCASCAHAQPIIEDLLKEYGDRVKLVVRDFPLSRHPQAFKAAEAAEAARQQGKYWEYSALLFQNQQNLEDSKLKEYATQVGLDRKTFDEAMAAGKFADRIQRDIRDGKALGISATPALFINGKPLNERTRQALKEAIESALNLGGAK